ncbi:hypothetical protein [Nocardia aurantia]|uniref:Uncharacterized protein n=1 Tax=Nocardia aurantia TaxID=2585199 RepID=A0A7K0DGY1_9NOCA|nr:hypothetical protein [Nocardia aurantia]MQY25070.1 hypothetical protein [Nocardia aurantia]
MDSLKLDPAALAAYTSIADSVSQQLSSAAAVAAGAVDPQRLAGELGVVGGEFATRFAAAVAEHAQALSTAGQLVATYGQVLRGYDGAVRQRDEETAAAVAQAGEVLA